MFDSTLIRIDRVRLKDKWLQGKTFFNVQTNTGFIKARGDSFNVLISPEYIGKKILLNNTEYRLLSTGLSRAEHTIKFKVELWQSLKTNSGVKTKKVVRRKEKETQAPRYQKPVLSLVGN